MTLGDQRITADGAEGGGGDNAGGAAAAAAGAAPANARQEAAMAFL